MSDTHIIWVTDEYSQLCAPGAWAKAVHSPAGWLEAAFTFQWSAGAFPDEELVPGPANIRPMAELIDQEQDSADDDYGPMVISQADYNDPGRWWL
jgi:hypothetical protein